MNEIVTNALGLAEQVAAGTKALAARNAPNLHLFRRGGWARVETDEIGRTFIQPLDLSRLQLELAEAAEWITVSAKGLVTPTFPPHDVVAAIRTLETFPDAVPPLRMLVSAPTLLPDGRILNTEGFDEPSGLYLAPLNGLVLPTIASNPTRDDAVAAMAVLDDFLSDYRWASPSDHANALGLLLTQPLRPLYGTGACVPLTVVDAPTAGSGKSLLAHLAATIATGYPASVQSGEGADPSEWRKRLTTHIVRQPAILLLDNFDKPISDPNLCAALTASRWTDRLLGSNTAIDVPIHSTFVATGNNIVVRGDAVRRCVWVRIDTGLEHPDLRTPRDFRHPELLADAARNQGRALAAVLTIGRAWQLAGCPANGVQILGSFESFCRTVGGCLAYAGVDGWLANLDGFRGRQTEDTSEWAAWFAAWFALFGSKDLPARELAAIAIDRNPPAWFLQMPASTAVDTFRDTLPAYLQPTTDAERARLSQRLGYALRARCDQIFGTLRLCRVGTGHTGVTQWSVVEHQPPVTVTPPPPTPARSRTPARALEAETCPPSPPSPPVELKTEVISGGDAEPSPPPSPPESPPSELTDTPAGGDGGDGGDDSYPLRARARDAVAVEVGLSPFPTPEYVLVRSAGELAEHLPRLLEQRWMGFDTETTGLDVVSDRVCLVQLAPESGPAVLVDVRQVDPRALAPLFDPAAKTVLVGHNLTFDFSMLGLGCPPSRRLFDTELLERLLGASWTRPPKGTYGLDQVVGRYLKQALPKDEQTSDWAARELSRAQLDYAVRDAAAARALTEPLREQIRAAGMREVAGIEMGCLPFMVWLNRAGAPLDVDRWVALADAAQADQTRLELQLTELAGTGGLMSAIGDFRFSTVNWGAPAQVLELLQQRGLDPRDGSGKPSTEAEALAVLAEDDPIIDLVLRYREASTRVDRYGLKWLAEWLRADGRIHPDYHQLGTTVGRMSVSDPMIQGVPRGPKYRSALRPSEGRVWIKGDYSQIDLRVIAEYAPDETLIRAYQNADDVHRLTAGRVRGLDPSAVSAEDRQAAKAANFGLSYGMGTARFIAQARSEYGVTFTRAQAQQFRDGFFGLYRGVKAWHDRVREPYGQETPIDIVAPSGRRRLGVKRFTEKLPSPIQQQVSDGFKRGLAELWRTRDQVGGDPKPVVVAHDEVGVEVDREHANDAAEWMRAGMTAGMQTILGDVPVVFETAVAQDWAGTPL